MPIQQRLSPRRRGRHPVRSRHAPAATAAVAAGAAAAAASRSQAPTADAAAAAVAAAAARFVTRSPPKTLTKGSRTQSPRTRSGQCGRSRACKTNKNSINHYSTSMIVE